MQKLFSELEVVSWSVDVPCVTGNLKKNQDYILDAKEAALFLKYGFGAGGHESTGDYTCGSHLCAVSPDGTVSKIWVLINAHALYDSSRNIVGLEGMVTDITNRKRAERNFQMLIDSAPDAIVAIDSNYNILLINTQTESIFGYKRKELLGSSMISLYPGASGKNMPGTAWLLCRTNHEENGTSSWSSCRA